MKNRRNIKAILYDRRGKVLSVGQNSYTKSHPEMARLAAKLNKPYKIFLHAEIDAILKCKDITEARSILITSTNKRGDIRLAEPCVICQSAIETLGLVVKNATEKC